MDVNTVRGSQGRAAWEPLTCASLNSEMLRPLVFPRCRGGGWEPIDCFFSDKAGAGVSSHLLIRGEGWSRSSLGTEQDPAFNPHCQAVIIRPPVNLQLVPGCGRKLLEPFGGTAPSDFSLEEAGLPITQEGAANEARFPN